MMSKIVVGAFAVGLVSIGVACGSPPPPSSPDPVITAGAGTEKDGDGDGIPDSVDKCLDKKEDGLGAQPKDGCPDGVAPTTAPPK
jgi:hypothetical protein